VCCDRRSVRKLAAEMPQELKELRGKAMLESECEYLGVADVTCPLCRGTGYLDREAFEFCPVCCGFREVPDGVADWVRARLAAVREESRPGRSVRMAVGAGRLRGVVRRGRFCLPHPCPTAFSHRR